MKKEDMKLMVIKDLKSNTLTVYPLLFPAIIVQVDDLKDAPKELAKSMECMFQLSIDENNIMKWDCGFDGSYKQE